MNRKQRRARLRRINEFQSRPTCPECGGRGPHWVVLGPMSGFWTCRKFYGPDGRRIKA